MADQDLSEPPKLYTVTAEQLRQIVREEVFKAFHELGYTAGLDAQNK